MPLVSRIQITRITGAIVFVISLVQFVLTVQPSVSFWDPGEQGEE